MRNLVRVSDQEQRVQTCFCNFRHGWSLRDLQNKKFKIVAKGVIGNEFSCLHGFSSFFS